MTQTSASRTSRIWLPVRVRMPMKIDTCCVMSSVANVTPKMSPKYLLRSPVSIRRASQFITRIPLSSPEGPATQRVLKQVRDQNGKNFDLASQKYHCQGLANAVEVRLFM